MGCTDSRNPHYDPLATDDDGSCLFLIEGCTSPSAINYRSAAQLDDGSCLFYVKGCMDAENFIDVNPQATFPDISQCNIPRIRGCTDSTAINYLSLANTPNVPDTCVQPPSSTR